MSKWSLHQLLSALHGDVEHRLRAARESFGHPTSKGDASEDVWVTLFNAYLPRRYVAARAFAVDSEDQFSDQIDVLIYDRQYTPLLFTFGGEKVVPAESVYAVFEAKQEINRKWVLEAQKKTASVRQLHRTSLPIPWASGTMDPKPPHHILGGILTLESEWSPPMGRPFLKALNEGSGPAALDVGCVAAHGYFFADSESGWNVNTEGRHTTGFLFQLIGLLQAAATVPMIDIQAYARWLNSESDSFE